MHDSAAEVSGANANDESKTETLKGGMQTEGVDVARTTGDGRKGSRGYVPPAKSSKAVKAM